MSPLRLRVEAVQRCRPYQEEQLLALRDVREPIQTRRAKAGNPDSMRSICQCNYCKEGIFNDKYWYIPIIEFHCPRTRFYNKWPTRHHAEIADHTSQLLPSARYAKRVLLGHAQCARRLKMSPTCTSTAESHTGTDLKKCCSQFRMVWWMLLFLMFLLARSGCEMLYKKVRQREIAPMVSNRRIAT